MSTAGLVLVGLMSLVLALFPEDCTGRQHCHPFSCGDMHTIRHPFRLHGDPRNCGDPYHELACENNRTVIDSGWIPAAYYYVQEINYVNKTMRVVTVASLDKDNCFFPRYSLSAAAESFPCPYSLHPTSYGIFFMNCAKVVKSPGFVDVSTTCINNSFTPKNSSYYYAFYGHLLASDVPELCAIEGELPSLFSNTTCRSISDIHQQLLKGFDLSYSGNAAIDVEDRSCTRIRSPLKVRSKSRPPSKRLESKKYKLSSTKRRKNVGASNVISYALI
ncbi:hypothetical protein L1049_021284 [Liquidambar formosana]|uniref:Wall-associated receptor kinase galacturonan-binding domain-containing protein n=1 Tax=Liquidambar formosana TaxID=63359 RepID=A0AAP0SAF3_LIQFO